MWHKYVFMKHLNEETSDLCTSAYLKLETVPNSHWAMAPYLEAIGTVVQPVYLLERKIVS